MVTSCPEERIFLGLKHVKNYLWTTILQQKLSALKIMHFKSGELRSLSFYDIINKFILKHEILELIYYENILS
jgi:hypothetical protein